MGIDKTLLTFLIQEFPFSPATAFWRAVEIGHVLSQSFPEGRGLDLGCGDGRLTRILIKKIGNRELIGVDMDRKETALAAHEGIYTRLHTVPADTVPEPAASFDFVFSNSVLEHIKHIENVIKEVARLLKPGGVFIFTVPSADFHRCLKGPLLPWVSKHAYLAGIDKRLAHERYWSPEEWKTALSGHNLEITYAGDYSNIHEVRRWETINRFTAGVLYALFREKKSPIEIQRTFGWRKSALKTPAMLARALSILLTFGLNKDKSIGSAVYGGLMIKARKQCGFDSSAKEAGKN